MGAYHATVLLVIAFGAFAIPLVSERIRIPVAVGEILFGILVGGYGVGLIQESEFTRFLGDFGFAYLMFLAGLEINFTTVERLGPRGLVIAGLAVCGVYLLALAAVQVFDQPIFLVLALGSMSLGLVLVALRDTQQSTSHLGQVVLIVGSLGEFVAIVLLTVTDLAEIHGMSTDLLIGLLKLLAVFMIAYLFLIVLRTFVWWFPEHFQKVAETHDGSEVAVRASFAVMLAFIAVAVFMGVETILGAFVAGALISFVFREKAEIEEKLSSFGWGFFVPIFFIEVGMGFDLLGILQTDFVELLVFLVVAGVLVRTLPLLLLRFIGLDFRQSVASGLILSAPLTLLVAISQVGEHTGLIGSRESAAVVLYAIVSAVAFPILFRAVSHRDTSADRM